MSKHTPEPWYDEVSHISGGTPGACEVVPIYGDDNNRARVVQCVNACQGMTDPAAEIAALRQAVEVLGEQYQNAFDSAYQNARDPRQLIPLLDGDKVLENDPVASKFARKVGQS